MTAPLPEKPPVCGECGAPLKLTAIGRLIPCDCWEERMRAKAAPSGPPALRPPQRVRDPVFDDDDEGAHD